MVSVDITTADITLRELVWMTQGQQEVLWNHTASLIAVIFPISCYFNKTPLDPEDFHPMKQTPSEGVSVAAEVRREMKRPELELRESRRG